MSSQRDLNRIIALEAQVIELTARLQRLEQAQAEKQKRETLSLKGAA